MIHGVEAFACCPSADKHGHLRASSSMRSERKFSRLRAYSQTAGSRYCSLVACPRPRSGDSSSGKQAKRSGKKHWKAAHRLSGCAPDKATGRSEVAHAVGEHARGAFIGIRVIRVESAPALWIGPVTVGKGTSAWFSRAVTLVYRPVLPASGREYLHHPRPSRDLLGVGESRKIGLTVTLVRIGVAFLLPPRAGRTPVPLPQSIVLWLALRLVHCS